MKRAPHSNSNQQVKLVTAHVEGTSCYTQTMSKLLSRFFLWVGLAILWGGCSSEQQVEDRELLFGGKASHQFANDWAETPGGGAIALRSGGVWSLINASTATTRITIDGQ